MDGSAVQSSLSQVLAQLTAAQRAAVSHAEGPLLILAGPGSGKTRVVTHRVAHLLLSGVPAQQIVALTFTNKAADEMRSRLDRLAPGQAVWVGTFHRFCARLLRRYAALVGLDENFTIYDTDDSQRVLLDVLEHSDRLSSHITPGQVAQQISFTKNNLISPEEFAHRPGDPLTALLCRVYPAYQQRLLQCNAVDFDDLLLHVAVLLRDNPELRHTLDERYRFILVDEYQDTNFAQYAIMRALSQDYPNLAVTGDPDQSIYGWRGANLNNILEFEQDFPDVRVVRLEQNYRSTQKILRVADQLIANNVQRKPKSLFTDNAIGSPVRLVEFATSRDEAEQIAARIAAGIRDGRRRPRDFAVFYRVNSLSRLFEMALHNAGIPYQVVRGLEFYQRKEIRDLLAYLQLLNNPRNDVAFQRIVNTPPRKIGKSTIEHLAEHARRHGLSLLETGRQAGLIPAITNRAAVHVAEFVALIDRLSLSAAAPLEEVLGQVLTQTGYERWLTESSDPEDRERLANVAELLNAAREFDERNPSDHPLESFLEQAALMGDTDDWEQASDRVSLMTLHAAKGLEFPVVFIVAIEQGLLPHERSRHEPHQLEEERRLLFVGITRCCEELQMSFARRRMSRGGEAVTVISPFLLELPREEMELVQLRAVRAPRGDAADTPWEMGSEDEPWVVDQPRCGKARRSRPSAARVMTAAELAGETGHVAAPEPDEFQQGMLVAHPDRGLGRIVALSGAGERRTATIQFFQDTAEAKFVLLHSDLRPVRSNTS
jgi:DNA helicase-2/ATP-dependent DNA helicase PcrA